MSLYECLYCASCNQSADFNRLPDDVRSGLLPGVEAEAAPALAVSARPMIARWLSSVGRLQVTDTHVYSESVGMQVCIMFLFIVDTRTGAALELIWNQSL